jgi:hypothetical protein
MATRDEELRIRIRLDEAGKLSAELGGVRKNIDEVGKSGKNASGGLGSLSGALGSLKSLLPALSAAAAVAGLKSLATTALDTAGRLSDIASRTGVGAEALQEYGFAATQAGVSAGGFEKAVEGFAKRVGEARNGTGSLVSALKDQDAALLRNIQTAGSTEQALDLIFKKLAETSSASDRAALANAAFGRSGIELLPMLDQGAAGLEAMRQRARDLGIVLSTDMVNAGDAAGDAIGELGQSLRGNLNQALLEAAPAIKSTAEGLTSLVGPSVSGLKTIAENADAVGIAFGVMAARSIVLQGIPAVIHSINAAMKLLAANPIVAILLATAGAAVFLRGKFREVTAELDRQNESLNANARIHATMKQAQELAAASGQKLTGVQIQMIQEGKSLGEVFREVGDEAVNTAGDVTHLAATGKAKMPELAATVKLAMDQAKRHLASLGEQADLTILDLDKLRSFDFIDNAALAKEVDAAIEVIETLDGIKVAVDEEFLRANLSAIQKLPKEFLDKIPEKDREILLKLIEPDTKPTLDALAKIPREITTIHTIVPRIGGSGPPISSASQRDLAGATPDLASLNPAAQRAVESGRREAFVTASGDTRTRLPLPASQLSSIEAGPSFNPSTGGGGMNLSQMRASMEQTMGRPIDVPITASGSPSRPFSEFFTSYAPGVIDRFRQSVTNGRVNLVTEISDLAARGAAASLADIHDALAAVRQEQGTLRTLFGLGVRTNFDTTTGRRTHIRDELGALGSVAGQLSQLEFLAKHRGPGQEADRRAEDKRVSVMMGGFDRLGRKLDEVATAAKETASETRQMKEGWSSGRYGSSIVGARSSQGFGGF